MGACFNKAEQEKNINPTGLSDLVYDGNILNDKSPVYNSDKDFRE